MTPAFEKVVRERFASAVPQRDFVVRSARPLRRLGFSTNSTLPLVACCRDELAGSLRHDVEEAWGPVFDLASLAGVFTAGVTGLAAAAAHAPIVDGVLRLVVYAAAHIAISATGIVGEVERPGLDHPSHACGALIALAGAGSASTGDPVPDPADLEQSLLGIRLQEARTTAGDDLVALTRAAHDVIARDAEQVFDAAVRVAESRDAAGEATVVFLSGVQIHGPEGATYLWPGTAQMLVWPPVVRSGLVVPGVTFVG